MTNSPSWLPALVLLETYQGNWERYLEAVYAFFRQDFINHRPAYQGIKLTFKRHPVIQGKEATFWHLISEGQTEAERTPDLSRCARIRWPRPIIEHSENPPIKVWENDRKGEKRICLWLEESEYLIILAARNDYVLLWTAYPVTENHRKRKLQKEYDAFKAGAAL